MDLKRHARTQSERTTGQTLYVDGSSGLDANPGTSREAFKDLGSGSPRSPIRITVMESRQRYLSSRASIGKRFP